MFGSAQLYVLTQCSTNIDVRAMTKTTSVSDIHHNR